MSKARRTEGPRAPLFFSAASVFMLLSATPASSQSVDVSALELCAGLATPELKIACFEAIIASSETAPVLEAGAIESPVADQPVARADAVPEVAPAVDTTPAAAPAIAVTPTSIPNVAATSTTAAAVVADTEFGQEKLDHPEKKEEEKENEIFRATVTDVTEGHNSVLYFHLDNGHVWRQLEARHLQYPKNGEFDINITRGMMGDYRLRIGENGKMVRIRRVE